MKLAMGPAATMAARRPTDFAWNVRARSASGMAATSSVVPALAAFMSPWNLT